MEGLVERGNITMLSADTGAGKSLVALSVALAVIHGKPWCGRPTNGKRVLYIDEENARRVVLQRMQGLGMVTADWQNFSYFLRVGVRLGDGSWHAEVEDEIDDFRPDMLVIDTAAAATHVSDSNNADAVAGLFRDVLRPLAETNGLVLLHHERKSQPGSPRNAGQAMAGSRQWAAQADAHVALKAAAPKPVVRELVSGNTERRYLLELENPKDRDGFSGLERIAIVSEHETGLRTPRWLRVERVGR